MYKSFKEQTWIKRDKYRSRVSWENDNIDFAKSCWIRFKFVSKRGLYPYRTKINGTKLRKWSFVSEMLAMQDNSALR